MTWTLMTIRELDDGHDDVLYPTPGDATNAVKFNDHDGRCSQPVTVTAIHLMERTANGKTDSLFKVADIKGSLCITDARITVACSKFDKGGGWIGGSAALALNAASMARAAIRRRGKMLVGHIRYPWLASVSYTTKTGWLSDESLRLIAATRNGNVSRPLILDLTLQKSSRAEQVGREITARSARYRLHHTRIPDSDRAAFEALTQPPVLQPVKGQYAAWRFPNYLYATPTTAYGNLHAT